MADMSIPRTDIPETDPCYRFTVSENQEFYSPGLPGMNTYTNNTDCVTVLEAPEGHLIKLDFRDYFEIEPSPDCANDFLEVRDGARGYNKRLERPFCGKEFPPMLMSSDRYLWIHFKSDDNIELKGFKAVYEYVPRLPILKIPEAKPCQKELTDMDEGVFGVYDIPTEIKEFTSNNTMPIDCIWAIKVRDNWRIQLQFERFELEKPNECDKNFIQVFSTRTDESHMEKEFCGSIADTVLSKLNIMYVRFYASPTVPKSSFEANFTAFREREDKSSNKDKQTCIKGEEFDCEDATCISIKLRCNHRYNCRFRWDEEGCPFTPPASLSDDHIIIIMVIFSLILSGMCFTFIYNCIKKLIRDHRTIQEYIRQSREQQLNELEKPSDPSGDKKSGSGHKSASRSRSNSSHSSHSRHHFGGGTNDIGNSANNTPCYVPGGELLPILIQSEHSLSPPNGDVYNSQNIYTVDAEGATVEMCDSACQTRESLFTTQGYSSGNSTPNHSVHTNSPPVPFSTFGYKKEPKFKAEARIEMAPSKKLAEKRRPYSVQTTKSAPDVIVTH